MSRFLIAVIIGALGLALSPSVSAMRTMDFLEKFELDDLSYIGMYSARCDGKEVSWATVLDPERLPHRVGIGHYVGRNFGMVIKITEEHLVIVEVHQNDTGEWIEHRVHMPKKKNTHRTRHLYEEDHALDMLGKIDDSGMRLKQQLIQCREIPIDNEKRLKCFDNAVGTLF